MAEPGSSSPLFMASPSVKPKMGFSRSATNLSTMSSPRRDDKSTQNPEGADGPPWPSVNFDTVSEGSGATTIDRLAELIRWVPGSNQELFDAEDKLLANVKTPHELVHVSIGLAPDLQGRCRSNGEGPSNDTKTSGSTSTLLPPATSFVPRFTLDGTRAVLDSLAHGAGFSRKGSVDPDGNCYINTLLIGDVAEAFAEVHKLSADHAARGNGGASEATKDLPSSAKATWLERFWASLTPFSRSLPKVPSSGPSYDESDAKSPKSDDFESADEKEEDMDAQGEEGTTGQSNASEGTGPGQRSHRESSSQQENMNGQQGLKPPDESVTKKQKIEKKDLVMVHGYAACIGFYFRNFDTLAEYFNIYAIDQLGWGASSRPSFTPQTAEEAETWFVEALELWRQELGLEKFVLLGHSFGGFVSSKYALKYPQHVEHLVLVGPAGFNHVSPKMQRFRETWKGFLLGMLWETNLTPQLMIRFLGPWSENPVKRAVNQRWSNLPEGQENMTAEEVTAFSEYIYQSMLAPMSGELCMKHVFSLGAFARRPLIDSAPNWKVPTTFIYGQDDIMDYRAGLAAAKLMPVPAEVLLITEVGHMLFLEKPTLFNNAVLFGCRALLPPDAPIISQVTAAVAPYLTPLTLCHGIPTDTDTALFIPQGRGSVRLANGWGIG